MVRSLIWGLIKRFSEDIDFRITVPEEENNRNKRSTIKKNIVAHLQNLGYQIDEEQIKARDNNRYFSIQIHYNKTYDIPTAIRSNILIEAYVRSPQMQPTYKPVSSLINELYKLPAEVENIACCDPIENAADKLSAVTWRIPDRKRGTSSDDRSIVRHLHDLAILENIVVQSKDFKKLVVSSMKEDENRPKNSSLSSSSSIEERFELMLNILEKDKMYSKEYDHFVRSMSYAPDELIPTYAKSVKALKQLIAHILK